MSSNCLRNGIGEFQLILVDKTLNANTYIKILTDNMFKFDSVEAMILYKI
jgi:hypothetical protein